MQWDHNAGLHAAPCWCELVYYSSTSGCSTPHPDFLSHVYFIQYADYPAILPCERSKALLGRELTPEENSIRGTLVTGFTKEDFMFLDVFEGTVRLSLPTYSFVGTNNLFVLLLARAD